MRTIVLFCAAMILAPVGSASDLKVSVTVSPIVALTVSDGGAIERSASGRNEAIVKIPLTRSLTLTVRAMASGQPSDSGCTLLARLDTPGTTKVTINGTPLSSVEDTVLLVPLEYESPVKLLVSAPEPQTAPRSVILSCHPK
jgi:hypothetical protein